MSPVNWIILPVFAVLFFILTCCVEAQSVVIAEDLAEQQEDSDFGMNRKHFTHSYIGLNFAAGAAELPGADIRYGRSRTIEYGYRYKRRLSNTLSFGGEIIARRYAFHVSQTEDKTVPDDVTRDREKLVFLDAGLGVYKRINFGQRGNYIGRFADAGVYAAFIYHSRHVYFYQEDGMDVRVRKQGLKYPEILNYGLVARFGFNNIVLKTTYRVSDLFKKSADFPEFPRYSIGLEIGLHPF